MSKCGTTNSHCCWFNGDVCQYLTKSTTPGYIWCCSLKRDKGTWAAVHTSPEYIENVKPKMVALGYAIDCGGWPPPGVVCNDCGQNK